MVNDKKITLLQRFIDGYVSEKNSKLCQYKFVGVTT